MLLLFRVGIVVHVLEGVVVSKEVFHSVGCGAGVGGGIHFAGGFGVEASAADAVDKEFTFGGYDAVSWDGHYCYCNDKEKIQEGRKKMREMFVTKYNIKTFST